jgi:hypothetical protein
MKTWTALQESVRVLKGDPMPGSISPTERARAKEERQCRRPQTRNRSIFRNSVTAQADEPRSNPACLNAQTKRKCRPLLGVLFLAGRGKPSGRSDENGHLKRSQTAKLKPMNPSRLYEPHREDAIAKQITALKYSTFVAMPLRDTFSYQSQEVYKKIIQKAAKSANAKRAAKRLFDVPRRVDDAPGQAVVITEEIVIGILESHFFLADVTFQNAGVILETGIALGLKSNRQIILMSQGTAAELHFDLRNNNVIFYRDSTAVEKLANAMIAAAEAFEEDTDRIVKSVVKSLSSPAIQCLNWFGAVRKSRPDQSLHEGVAGEIFKEKSMGEALLIFQLATQELIQKKLLYMDYVPRNVSGGPGRYGLGATELGWALIESLWPEFSRK